MTTEERITRLEEEMEQKYSELSELRAQADPVPLKDYEFIGSDHKTVKLSELMGDSDRMIIVHNMGRQCPYCTVWADGFSDSYHRISKKVPFVVTSKETVEEQKKNIEERNWQFPMVSSKDNRFLEDLGFLPGDLIYPGLAHVSKNPAGELFFHSRHTFGGGDNFGMLWHILDLVGKWDPEEYKKPE